MTAVSSCAQRTVLACVVAAGLIATIGCGAGSASLDPAAFEADVAAWRAERESKLLAEDGWLTLVALHWLEQGETRFGTDAVHPLILPSGSAAGFAGSLRYENGQVTLVPADGVGIRVQGVQVSGPTPLSDDGSAEPSVVEVGRLTLHILLRGDAHGVRVKDPQSPERTGFRGLDYFPADRKFRPQARFRPYEELKTVEIPAVQGPVSEMVVPGTVEFRIDGRDFSLQVFADSAEDQELFLIFKDETSGVESYGLGRYLYAIRDGETVLLDFNRAYNPPCAFTAYATCPLPPRQNWMAIPVKAGERTYAKPS